MKNPEKEDYEIPIPNSGGPNRHQKKLKKSKLFVMIIIIIPHEGYIIYHTWNNLVVPAIICIFSAPNYLPVPRPFTATFVKYLITYTPLLFSAFT